MCAHRGGQPPARHCARPQEGPSPARVLGLESSVWSQGGMPGLLFGLLGMCWSSEVPAGHLTPPPTSSPSGQRALRR